MGSIDGFITIKWFPHICRYVSRPKWTFIEGKVNNEGHSERHEDPINPARTELESVIFSYLLFLLMKRTIFSQKCCENNSMDDSDVWLNQNSPSTLSNRTGQTMELISCNASDLWQEIAMTITKRFGLFVAGLRSSIVFKFWLFPIDFPVTSVFLLTSDDDRPSFVSGNSKSVMSIRACQEEHGIPICIVEAILKIKNR